MEEERTNVHTSKPTNRRVAALLWSGGKDATLALEALEAAGVHVAALVVTVAGPSETVTMHEVGLPLIKAQARALGRPLHVMRQPEGASNKVYERQLEKTLAPLKRQRISAVAAGDLFLDDVRAYREALIHRLGFAARFPLWHEDPAALARRFLARGYRAVVASVDTTQLDGAFAGRLYDEHFLEDLPEGIDPCGEEGAFHTFVFDGPRFARAVPLSVGVLRQDGRMAYVELSL